MDPYVLFLAQRLSATPYIYAYDLDVDAALAGGTGGVPDDAQSDRIRAHPRRARDRPARPARGPPSRGLRASRQSPLITETDAWDDFEAHCPRAAPWVRANYRETARFGHDHVWLRTISAPQSVEEPATPPDDP